jgi:glycosyltransferase involved in cell wall biosynthesis
MKILLTIDFPPEIGGIQRYLYDRVSHLFTLSDCVIVGTSTKMPTAQLSLPCRVISCCTPLSWLNKKWSLLPMYFKIATIAASKQKCTVEAGNVYAAIPAFVAAYLFKNFTYTVYCYGKELLSLQDKTFRAYILRAVLKKATIRYALTDFTISLLKNVGISGECCKAPPKISLKRYPDRQHSENPDYVQLLSVGRLVTHKGHSVLIDAVATLPASIQWRLTIAGSGPQYSKLQYKVNSLSHNKISIKQFLTDEQLHDEYRRADIFIFPSLPHDSGVEGFGIVLLEAMVFKLPIIASNSGGIPEVLGEDCAILVPPGDSKALSDALKNCIGNKRLRQQLCNNAFKRCSTLFLWD